MRPTRQSKIPAPTSQLRGAHPALLALAIVALGASPAVAQEQSHELPPPDSEETIAEPSDAQAPREIDFEADNLEYDSEADIVRASGNVLLRSEDRSVRAESVVWNRPTGQIFAEGNVRFVDENGNELYTENVELTDEFEAGAMSDLLLALREGGRLAARGAERLEDGTIMLDKAAYSACAVTDGEGCPKNPSWRITADRVIYDAASDRVKFKGAFLELFGARILPMPGLTVRTNGQPISGFLIPDLRISESNGVEINGEYYWRIDDNRDLTLGAFLYTEATPMVSAKYRQLATKGAFQVTGYLTHSRRISRFTGTPVSQRDTRGYVHMNGRFQMDPNWSFNTSVRLVTDRTFLRRYDISRDDRLRSMFEFERIDEDSYFALSGWATQTLRLNAAQGQVPVAFPVVDYRKRVKPPAGLDGTLELQLNTLAISRNAGQDTQRAFAGARWDLSRVTPLGQVVTFSALARGDVYHTDGTGLTATAVYRGNPGWQARGVALGAVDVKWPFVGELFGGTQVFTPRVQFVASPQIKNLAIPNEDARAIDLEDSNLFALNRFPGYDRIEDGARVTYGLDWQLTIPNWRIKSTVGQSYRVSTRRQILPDGTGLSEKVSDFVGRTEVRYKDFLNFTHRFRLDKDNLAIRRNEFDATIGSQKTYVEVGYLRLNRDITTVEDLQDREELRAAARVSFARYWSLFGSGVFNLTDRNEDPTFTSDGFEPIRTRLGIAYQDDCLEFGLTWRRDYITTGDAQRGDTFQLHFALRNLGVR